MSVVLCPVCSGAYDDSALDKHFKIVSRSKNSGGELTASAIAHIIFIEEITAPKRYESAKYHFERRTAHERGDFE